MLWIRYILARFEANPPCHLRRICRLPRLLFHPCVVVLPYMRHFRAIAEMLSRKQARAKTRPCIYMPAAIQGACCARVAIRAKILSLRALASFLDPIACSFFIQDAASSATQTDHLGESFVRAISRDSQTSMIRWRSLRPMRIVIEGE